MERFRRGIDAYKSASKKDNSEKKAENNSTPKSLPNTKPAPESSVPQRKNSSQHNNIGVPGPKIPEGVDSRKGFLKSVGEGTLSYKKVAKFLLLLGKDEAAKILAHFEKDEIENITREIAKIKRIEKVEAVKILEEFGFLKTREKTPQGGESVAMDMLSRAFGDEKAKTIARKAIPDFLEQPFSFLEDLELHQVVLVLKKEPAWVLAVIIPFLEPSRAADIIKSLNPELQKDVILRIAKRGKVDPEVIKRVEEILKERIRKQGKVVTEEIDGKSTLAGILKYMNPQEGENILEGLNESDPDMADQVKQQLLTFDIVLQIDTLDLQNLLRDYPDKDIALLLKDKDGGPRNRILSSLSERRRQMVEDELRFLPPQRRVDLEQLTADFLQQIRSLEEDGLITVYRENTEYI